MSAGKLPALTGREAADFFDHFATKWELRDNRAVGQARDGQAFSVHLEHRGRGMRPDILAKALTYLGVSREEFFGWYGGGRRR